MPEQDMKEGLYDIKMWFLGYDYPWTVSRKPWSEAKDIYDGLMSGDIVELDGEYDSVIEFVNPTNLIIVKVVKRDA